jgi:hypothetical protein
MLKAMARGGGGSGGKPQLSPLDADQLSDSLALGTVVTRFRPTVDVGDGSTWTTVWLPEIELSGSGDTIDEAKAALVEILGMYLDDLVADDQLAAARFDSTRDLLTRATAAHAAGELAAFVFGV